MFPLMWPNVALKYLIKTSNVWSNFMVKIQKSIFVGGGQYYIYLYLAIVWWILKSLVTHVNIDETDSQTEEKHLYLRHC